MGLLSKVTQIGQQQKRAAQVLVPQADAPQAKPSQAAQRLVRQPPRYGKTCGKCGTYFVAERINETVCQWCTKTWVPPLEPLSE